MLEATLHTPKRCNNAEPYPILGTCPGKVPTVRLKVIYNEVESDTLDLCSGCASAIAKDARKHGYKVKRQPLDV